MINSLNSPVVSSSFDSFFFFLMEQNDGYKRQLNTLLSQTKHSLDPEGCSTSRKILGKFLNFSEPKGPPLLQKEIQQDFFEDIYVYEVHFVWS